jgi:hypothetical protein
LKSKLLIIELWGLGDLVIATPFLRAAAEQFDVTLLAKPYFTHYDSSLDTVLWKWLVYAAAYIVGSVLFGIIMANLIELPVLALRDRLFPSRS